MIEKTQMYRDWALKQAERAITMYGYFTQTLTEAQTKDYRDGADGWNVTEVMCHMRDFDEIFHKRAVMITEQENPDLGSYDHDQMVIDGNYNAQDKDKVFADFAAHREQFAEFFAHLTEDQWERAGNHPERDYPFTLLDAIMQVGLHDANHLEQITRILLEKKVNS